MGSDYEAYASHIAAEMARNGHPRLCAARGDVTQATTPRWWTRLRTSSPAEDPRIRRSMSAGG